MKNRRRYTQKRPPPTRRWHVPPPLIHGSETLEGGAILHEWADESAVVLWQVFRDVMLWATVEPEHRKETFAASAGCLPAAGGLLDEQESPRAAAALETLKALAGAPSNLKEEQVARACRVISEWAYEKGKYHTALAFAQNAALAGQSNAAAAHWVATIAGRMNDHARAEGWFRRAVGLARQSRDWRMYSLAFGGLGNLYIRRGNLPAARRLHTRALRGARRGGMRREQAAALHDLFVVAAETGNTAEAERLARHALEAFGTRNTRLHILAHDVAYFWMEQGHFGRALVVFKAVLPLVGHRVERIMVLANLARAAGGVADSQTLEETVARIDSLIAEPELRIAAGRALIEVARGYFSLNDFDRAERAALGALASATEFREAKIQFAAESLLAAVRDRRTAATEIPASVESAHAAYGDELAAEFVKTLETIAGATP
jgi:Tfp pilus assembly protein PilF